MTSTTAGIIRKGFRLFSRVLQNIFCFGPYPDLLQLPLHVEDMDARERQPKHGRNIGTTRAFTPGTPRTIYLYGLDAELTASQSAESPEPQAGWGLS